MVFICTYIKSASFPGDFIVQFFAPCCNRLMFFITRNMGQDGDGHAHFDQIWRPNITINYMGVDQNIKF